MTQRNADDASSGSSELQRRPYGPSRIPLSIVGLGGIVLKNAEQADADRVVADAVERGVNYFDVGPAYGEAEVRLGPALAPYRRDVFLACKTRGRQAGEAKAEMQRSMERLQTDYFDLYQLHAISDVARDVDAAFAADGVVPMLIEAKKEGRVRHLGFSAHSVEAALAAMDRYDFDSILWPVNFACYHQGRFGPQVVDAARQRGMSVLALKSMARTTWSEDDTARERFSKCWYEPLTDPREAELALRFTLSQAVTAALPPGEESLFRMALDLAMRFRPLEAEDEEHLEAMAASLNPIFVAS